MVNDDDDHNTDLRDSLLIEHKKDEKYVAPISES